MQVQWDTVMLKNTVDNRQTDKQTDKQTTWYYLYTTVVECGALFMHNVFFVFFSVLCHVRTWACVVVWRSRNCRGQQRTVSKLGRSEGIRPNSIPWDVHPDPPDRAPPLGYYPPPLNQILDLLPSRTIKFIICRVTPLR